MEVKAQGNGGKTYSGNELIELVNHLVRYEDYFSRVVKNDIPKKYLIWFVIDDRKLNIAENNVVVEIVKKYETSNRI